MIMVHTSVKLAKLTSSAQIKYPHPNFEGYHL